jgi:hypothetical protein
MSSRRKKTVRQTKGTKAANKGKEQRKAQNQHRVSKKSSKLKNSKLPTLSMQALPLDRYYYVSFLNHPVNK